MDIVGQLKDGMSRFSTQESRVATFILENLSFTASASIDELAAKAASARPPSPALPVRWAATTFAICVNSWRRRASAARPGCPGHSAALPSAWRDRFDAVNLTLTHQLEHTSENALDKLKARLQTARAVHCFALGEQDVPLATLLQHQLLPLGIALNLCQDGNLMRMIASTLSDDHLLLVLATGPADNLLQGATLQARMQGATIFALTPENHALSNMAAEVLPLSSSAQAARYALLMLVDLLNDTLNA
jgi:Transcriptional regulators